MSRGRSRITILFALLLVAAARVPAADAVPITLELDAREAPQKILHSRLVIPAAPGPLTLVYPKWIPGEHGPTGPLTDVAGLRFTAGGKALRWERDLVDMHAVQCVVPAGAAFFTRMPL